MLVYLLVLAVVVLVGATVFFGPPYLPTLQKSATAALDLLDLKPGQTLLELGSGDGRVVYAAAQRGLRVVGIELSPLLVLVARVRCWRYRRQVKIIWGNYFRVQWPPAEGIFTFMIPRQMAQLDTHIMRWPHRPVRVASFGFAIPGRQPVRRRDGVLLYEYKK